MQSDLIPELVRLIKAHVNGGERRFGIEQEFTVNDRSGSIDFRTIARSGRLPGKKLDRADPGAHRLAWGGVITADGAEAEIATPPAALAPGFTDVLTNWLSRGRHDLAGILGEDVEALGYSTHLNVEVADSQAVALAHRFVRRHAGSLMLLMDRDTSPGLLVRPRRSRLELGGEYVAGAQLTAASVFAGAAARDCEASRCVRPLVSPKATAATERFGWFVNRAGFGVDLYREGRAARVGRNTGQDLLEWSWERSRPHAETFATPHELAIVDDVVAGARALPCEDPIEVGYDEWNEAAWGPDLTEEYRRGRMTLTAVVASWDHVCFSLQDAVTKRTIALGAQDAGRFVEAFKRGDLDQWCARALAAAPEKLAVLSDEAQIGAAGVFSSIDPSSRLVRDERNPRTGWPGGIKTPPGARHQKNNDGTPRRHVSPKRIAAIGGLALVLVLVAGVVAFAARRGDSGRRALVPPTVVATTKPPVSTIAPALAVPQTLPATTAASTTAAALAPFCIATILGGQLQAQRVNEAGFTPVADQLSFATGDTVRTDATGFAQLVGLDGGTITRLDAGTQLTCASPRRTSQNGGRTWSRTGSSPLMIAMSAGSVAVAPNSAIVVDCRQPNCVVVLLQGHAEVPLADGATLAFDAPRSIALLPPSGDPAQVAQIVALESASQRVVPYDSAFADPWTLDNALKDVAYGFGDPTAIYARLGPAYGSLEGQFAGKRTVIVAECTNGPCDFGPPVGNVADRTYNFSIDCSAGFPCTGNVVAQYGVGNEVRQATVPLAFDGATYTWGIDAQSFQCGFDNNGDGVFDTLLGELSLSIRWKLTPTSAEVRDGRYVVTAFHATADGVNAITRPDPQCSQFGPSHNVGDIVGSR